MCQRKKIGKIFGLIQKQLLVVKYLFWSIMPVSIHNMDGRPASISCSQELVMEPSLPLKKWGLQRSVSFPLCFLNKTMSHQIMAEAHFASQNILLIRNTLLLLKRTVYFKLGCYSLVLNTLYPSAHLAYWKIFLLGTLCSPTPFASENSFLLSTSCFSTHFAPQPTLLLSPLCTLEHFAFWNIFLLGILCSPTPFAS